MFLSFDVAKVECDFATEENFFATMLCRKQKAPRKPYKQRRKNFSIKKLATTPIGIVASSHCRK